MEREGQAWGAVALMVCALLAAQGVHAAARDEGAGPEAALEADLDQAVEVDPDAAPLQAEPPDESAPAVGAEAEPAPPAALESGDEDDPYTAAACEVVFGDAEARTRNSALRRRAELQIDAGGYAVDINHSHAWSAPTPVDYQQLELVETYTGDDGRRRALVYLDDSFEEEACPAGHYEVARDADIGVEGRVLAVLDDVVLVELHDELRYLRVDGTALPAWRMLWHSPWAIVTPPDYGKSKASPARRPARPRKAAKRARRRKR